MESMHCLCGEREYAWTLIAIAATFVGVPSEAQAWGPVGHETVAYLAEDSLNPAAKQKIDDLLGPDLDLASIANWADQIRATTRPDTAPWHFIDIEDRLPETKADEPKFCKDQTCVVDQIGLALAALKSPSTKQAARLDALKFLVHFVGDVHQPLHCADDSDRGGNNKYVRYKKTAKRKGTKINLHAYWDHLAQVKTTDDPRELASELALSDAQKKEFDTGVPANWAWESFQIAHDTIYAEFEPGPTKDTSGINLPADYYTPKMREIVNKQLQRAGARLAMLLNAAFGP
jgi:hypothetical protein